MDEAAVALANQVAKKLAYKWRVDRDDISQEILVTCLKDNALEAWESVGDLGKEEYLDLIRQTRVYMWYAGERYCRREKAAREGYSVTDEVFYSTARLEQLLEWYLSVGIEEHAPIGRAESVSRGDLQGGDSHGNHTASMLDVARGLGLIPPEYRVRLEVRYGPLCAYSDEQIASMAQSEVRRVTGWHHDRLRAVLGETRDQVRHRVDTSLRALQRVLGGVNPWHRGPVPRKVASAEV